MRRSRHPKKAVEEVLQELEAAGWRIEASQGHAWGKAKCPRYDRTGCVVSIWSTPRNPESHARHLRNILAKCPHGDD